MSVHFIQPDNKVLEIGGNINPLNVDKLKENRDLNNLNFTIEDCVISKTVMIYKIGNL